MSAHLSASGSASHGQTDAGSTGGLSMSKESWNMADHESVPDQRPSHPSSPQSMSANARRPSTPQSPFGHGSIGNAQGEAGSPSPPPSSPKVSDSPGRSSSPRSPSSPSSPASPKSGRPGGSQASRSRATVGTARRMPVSIPHARTRKDWMFAQLLGRASRPWSPGWVRRRRAPRAPIRIGGFWQASETSASIVDNACSMQDAC
jgi:hypothetical protein